MSYLDAIHQYIPEGPELDSLMQKVAKVNHRVNANQTLYLLIFEALDSIGRDGFVSDVALSYCPWYEDDSADYAELRELAFPEEAEKETDLRIEICYQLYDLLFNKKEA